MDIKQLLDNKEIKPKDRTEELSKRIVDKDISISDLIAFAEKSKDPVKATCIEALEFATRQDPSLASEEILKFVSRKLTEKAPRIKWESAKVIGNIAHNFPGKLDEAIAHLLVNTEHTGTVVRWSAAFALGEILKMNTGLNKELLPAVEAIIEREEKNSIKKIYQSAIKKLKK